MELSVSSETTFFNMKLQLEICPQLRTGSSAEDTGRIDTSLRVLFVECYFLLFKCSTRVLFVATTIRVSEVQILK